MSRLNPVTYSAETLSLFPTNGVGAISAEDLREQLDNTSDSVAFVATDTTAPTVNDDEYKLGNLWVDSNNNLVYYCLDNTASAAVWKQIADTDTAQTLTNKTIDATSNNITNLSGSAIVSGTIDIARLPEATSADFLSNTADKILSTDQTWGAASETTLTDAATVSVDFSTGINFSLTLAGNRTLDNPSNAKPGQSGYIRVIQDGTGSRTLSYGANWVFPSGTSPTLTTTPSAEDMLFYVVLSPTKIFVNSALNIS